MLTIDGDIILPDGSNAPSLKAIAVGLGRTWRWGRQRPRFYNVLAHSLLVYEITAKIEGFDVYCPPSTNNPDYPIARCLRALMHDAHEFARGDLPTPWKTAEDRGTEEDLQRRISLRFDLGQTLLKEDTVVADADYYAAQAESTHLIDHEKVKSYAHPSIPSPLAKDHPFALIAERVINACNSYREWVYPDGDFVQSWIFMVEAHIEALLKESIP